MGRLFGNGIIGIVFSSLLVVVATAAGAQDQSNSGGKFFDKNSFQGYEAYKGAYGQFGISVGEIDLDNNVDVDTGGGFTITGGYRVLPWLSAEANFSFLGGGEIENTNRDVDYFSFTFGPKLYPFGFLDEQPIPEFFQPYGLIAVGGGEYDVERGDDESVFVARFIFGFDLWFTDHIGSFIEGGYHVADDDDIDGTGVFTFGAQYRF